MRTPSRRTRGRRSARPDHGYQRVSGRPRRGRRAVHDRHQCRAPGRVPRPVPRSDEVRRAGAAARRDRRVQVRRAATSRRRPSTRSRSRATASCFVHNKGVRGCIDRTGAKSDETRQRADREVVTRRFGADQAGQVRVSRGRAASMRVRGDGPCAIVRLTDRGVDRRTPAERRWRGHRELGVARVEHDRRLPRRGRGPRELQHEHRAAPHGPGAQLDDTSRRVVAGTLASRYPRSATAVADGSGMTRGRAPWGLALASSSDAAPPRQLIRYSVRDWTCRSRRLSRRVRSD